MGNPFYQPVNAADPPDQITPAGGVSDPAGYASVTPHGQGPAPYNIQAEMPDVQSAWDASMAVAAGDEGTSTGLGLPDRNSPRQQESLSLLASPQGAGAFSIDAGFSGQPSETWANDMSPGANAETPDQGMGDFQGTTQEGLQKYGTT